jgi:hypothetical protein
MTTELTSNGLRDWRRAQGWDVPELATRMRQASAGHVAGHDGLVRMIRAWERGDHVPTERYQLLYQAVGYPDRTRELAEVASQSRRLWRVLWLDIVLTVLVTALAGALTVVALQAHDATDRAAAAQRAGQVVGQRICSTFGKLAALQPPHGDRQANPSRAYEQDLHAILDEIGADLKCPPARP